MIVITTPTGDIGSQVLQGLLQTVDDDLRVIVRDAVTIPSEVRDRVDVVTGSHGDPDVVDRAFTGADAVFWVPPPNPRTPSLREAFTVFTQPAADAMKTHRVGHVVGVSALGRGTANEKRAGLVSASLEMDDLIAGTGAAYRALVNPSFMDNLLRQVASVRDAGVCTGTEAPDRKSPTVATGDIAAAAVRLLTDRSWTGAGEIAILRPEDLSPQDMAAIMSDVLGKPVRYQRQSLDDLAAGMSRYGAGAAFVEGMVKMMRAKEEGLDIGVERTPETTSPTTFRPWCEDVLKPAVSLGN
jgi:uncharacterized protein YbjT (DUF2867 family)